jgi:molybdopterin molybdotransferase
MAGSTLVEVDDARKAILSAAERLPVEPLELGFGALGRTLGQDIVATTSVPPFANSAMDGFAVRAVDLADAGPERPVSLSLVGESRAGRPASAGLGAGEAIAISTGAVLPEGADSVLRVEDSRSVNGATVLALSAPETGRDVRRAGEDVKAGDTVLRAGSVIGAAELGALASLDRTSIACVRRPRVSVLVSGDELLGAGEPERPGAIRDSSSWSIAALALRGGGDVRRVARARDDPGETRVEIEAALADADVTVICGGVSVGEHDHVRPGLAALGVEERFWRLALKPGSPAWFGVRDDTLVFGLPGNPVSAIVTFILLVGPALRAMLGRDPEQAHASAILDEDYAKPRGRAHALRCRLRWEDDGLHARTTGPQGSHVLTSMLGADALAIIASELDGVRAGERVPVVSLREWTGVS